MDVSQEESELVCDRKVESSAVAKALIRRYFDEDGMFCDGGNEGEGLPVEISEEGDDARDG